MDSNGAPEQYRSSFWPGSMGETRNLAFHTFPCPLWSKWGVHSLTALSDIVQVKTAKGLALQDILTEVHLYVHRSECSYKFILFQSNCG